jgi:hypothetical protein
MKKSTLAAMILMSLGLNAVVLGGAGVARADINDETTDGMGHGKSVNQQLREFHEAEAREGSIMRFVAAVSVFEAFAKAYETQQSAYLNARGKLLARAKLDLGTLNHLVDQGIALDQDMSAADGIASTIISQGRAFEANGLKSGDHRPFFDFWTPETRAQLIKHIGGLAARMPELTQIVKAVQ